MNKDSRADRMEKNFFALVRFGTVTSVDKASLSARVQFADLQGMVSAPLRVLQRIPQVVCQPASLTYKVKQAQEHTHAGETEEHIHGMEVASWLPEVGSLVLCLMYPAASGTGVGFILGAI